MRITKGWIIAAAMITLPALPAGPVGADPAHQHVVQERSSADLLVEAGRDLYQNHCVLCHGDEGRGDGPLAADLRQAPADLTRIAARRGGVFPEHEIHEIIDGRRRIQGHGARTMPVWGRYFGRRVAGGETEDQLRARFLLIVEYLKSIQREAAR